MAGEWHNTTIGEQATLQRGVDITKAEQQPGSIPVISSSGISSFHNEAAARGPGVILGRKGVVGSVYYIDTHYWPHDTTLWVKDFHGNVPRFVYYFFKWKAPTLASMDVGSANPTLNRNHVHPIPVLWPPREAQQAIAHVLGTLDDKIELNRRTNETLEAMARALFKSWFVDFDPVRAKADGRAPVGMDARTAALFPCGFQRADLGEIPDGWSWVSLYEAATYVNGAAYKAFQPNTESRGLPIVKIAELKDGITAQTKYSDVDMPEKYRLRTGDILFSWSGNPDTSIDVFVWTHGAAWLNQHIFRVEPRIPEERTFILAVLKHLRPIFAEIARNKQTTGLGHVTAGDMKRLLIAAPDGRGMEAWNRHAAPLFDAIFRNTLESQTLATLRDALLPRLLSGELPIPDAERIASKGAP